jgi:GNAT superfamily N-acetyltransferase
VSVVIRPAHEGDVDGIVTLLSTQMNRKIAPARWRRLFDGRWRPADTALGLVAVAGERVIGFVGTVHAEREIDGRRERVVNICAWYLDKAHRGQGTGAELMRRATEDDRASYTILTSSSKTLKILDAVGYRVLDDERLVFTRRPASRPALTIIDDPARIMAQIPASARRLIDDHAGMPVEPVLIEAEGEASLLLLTRSRKGDDVPWLDLLHVGNRDLFTRHAQDVADALLPAEPNAVLGADLRFFSGAADGGTRARLGVPRFYKSTRLRPEQFDNLYSEVQLMGLKLD